MRGSRGSTGRPGGVHPVVVGAVLAGSIGCVVGLILGLRSYPATAWFAVIEVGLPAATAGAVVGFGVHLVQRRRAAD